MAIPSLKKYVLVTSTEYIAEIFTRNENDEWIWNIARGEQQ